MNTIEKIKARYQQVQSKNGTSVLTPLEQQAFEVFNQQGIPTVRNEEWKYTRIASVFNKEFLFASGVKPAFDPALLEAYFLPGHAEANVLVFVNGTYLGLHSTVRSAGLTVQSMEEAANNEYKDVVAAQLGHSGKYLKDGVHALNTAFAADGVFIGVKPGQVIDRPVYIYQVTDAQAGNVLSQPRTLVYAGRNAQVQIVETYLTLGASESFTNEVVEVVMEADAVVDYYKIQNDRLASQVSTTHFHQLGKSVANAVSITLDGGLVRNNLNIVMDAEYTEANLHGLYFLKGQTHVDNHTVVDNRKPHCLSNELYKGIVDDSATAVFNGKIYVQPDAQKINAFQSNKNILLSDSATVNTKPQLEIFADDVKCSHGCTIGQLDEDALFYLRSRGVGEKTAKALLVQAFALDILEHIKLPALRVHIEQLISQRLEVEA